MPVDVWLPGTWLELSPWPDQPRAVRAHLGKEFERGGTRIGPRKGLSEPRPASAGSARVFSTTFFAVLSAAVDPEPGNTNWDRVAFLHGVAEPREHLRTR